MKKYSFVVIACALALSLTSCHKIFEKIFESEEKGEADDEYYIERYEVTDRQNGRTEAVEVEEEEYYGPSDVDILDLPITDTTQIDVLLDDFENCNSSLRRLNRDRIGNAAAIDNVMNRMERLSEKLDEASGYMTFEQIERYLNLINELSEISES